MGLITRCPTCGTMFKVVADQLKISEGWVRCGHCAEVFDATAHMVDESALEQARRAQPLFDADASTVPAFLSSRLPEEDDAAADFGSGSDEAALMREPPPEPPQAP